MRFPRIKALRRDKTPAEIDTVDYARTLCAPTGSTGALKKGDRLVTGVI